MWGRKRHVTWRGGIGSSAGVVQEWRGFTVGGKLVRRAGEATLEYELLMRSSSLCLLDDAENSLSDSSTEGTLGCDM